MKKIKFTNIVDSCTFVFLSELAILAIAWIGYTKFIAPAYFIEMLAFHNIMLAIIAITILAGTAFIIFNPPGD